MKTQPKITKLNRKVKQSKNVVQSCNISKGQPTNIQGWFTPFGDSRQKGISVYSFCSPANIERN